ncbi:MAG: MmgE/PrpD family protein [Ruminococcaceae bacterium]|jgi:2-methylcitrate dehydratase PrpD|nr:MmgE/PrpD family protein [Oscillospiraceae bacterium]
MTLQEMISEFVLRPAPFTEQALYLAKRSILDTVGAMVIGSETFAVKAALAVADGAGCCTVVGSGQRLSGRDAAFVNGISGHELELDDTSSSNLGHPTVAVLPALLAVGEEIGCSGQRLLESFLIATEVTCKVGRICAHKLHEKGWHCSSITAGLGAAAGCAYLLELDREQICHAIGIAASMASGIRENFGTLTKSVHIGKVAEDGYRAAKLAQAGFTSSPVALEGREGFLYEYADLREQDDAFHTILASMGRDWDICAPGFTLKRWPSCSSCHRPLDAILETLQAHQIAAEEIESIRIGLGATPLRELITPDPRDGEEAKFSVGFQVGLYLSGRENAAYNYTTEIIRLPEIQNIIKRTVMYHETAYDDLPSDAGAGPAFITITCKDGRSFTRERAFPVGHLTDPISDGDLKAKFLTCTVPTLGQAPSEALYDVLMKLESVTDIRAVMAQTC